jgi:hypothetical protein
MPCAGGSGFSAVRRLLRYWYVVSSTVQRPTDGEGKVKSEDRMVC